jgi:protein SCO1/2
MWDNRGMPAQAKILRFAIMCAALVAGISAALVLNHRDESRVDLATGSAISPSRALPDFSLIDDHGRTFAPSDLRGHWTMMFFGYTNCPDFCPTTLSTLAALDRRLKASGAPVRPRIIFMSVDAKRDTPAQLAKYVPYFDPDFVGVTAATQPQIEALAAKLGVGVIITPRPDGSYSVDHSGAIFVVNPQGRLTAILTGPFTVSALETDFQRIASGPA